MITDSTVKWYKGLRDDCRVLQTSYTVQNKILQVLWCTFGKRESVMRCLCVREKGQLTLFMINGTVHYIPLPFEVGKIVSLFTLFTLFFFSLFISLLLTCIYIWFSEFLIFHFYLTPSLFLALYLCYLFFYDFVFSVLSFPLSLSLGRVSMVS